MAAVDPCRKARHLLLASQGPALPWLQAAGVLPESEILLGSDFPEDASEVWAEPAELLNEFGTPHPILQRHVVYGSRTAVELIAE